MSNGVWQKIAVGACALLATITLAWNASRSDDEKKQDLAIKVLEENVRNIHHEKTIDRGILNRIDLNTGGDGDAPAVRPLLKKEDG